MLIHAYLLRSCFAASFSGLVLQFPCLVGSAISCRIFYAPVLNCISRIGSPTRSVKTTRRVFVTRVCVRERHEAKRASGLADSLVPVQQIARHRSFLVNGDINNKEVWCERSWKEHQPANKSHIINTDTGNLLTRKLHFRENEWNVCVCALYTIIII